jgi:hypothetical protein
VGLKEGGTEIYLFLENIIFKVSEEFGGFAG